jgi:hypothetical protein
MKNRPALGEIAIRELLADNLLKFNHFLTDVRGRNVKSYMKVPVPAVNDATYETFAKSLAKHDINVEEYRSVYRNSSIPSNNNLSALAMKIFETDASFVTEYQKYELQLHNIVQQHVQDRNIRKTEDGLFVVTNRGAFLHQFHEIGNLVPPNRQEKTRGGCAYSRYTTGSLLE